MAKQRSANGRQADAGLLRLLGQPRLQLALLTGLILAVRLFWLHDGLFHHDAARLAQSVEASFAQGSLEPLHLFSPELNGRHGVVLLNLLLYVPYRLATGEVSSEGVLLFSSALFSTLAAVALYALARPLLGSHRGGLIAAAFFAFFPLILTESVGAKEHSLSLLVTATALALGLRGLQQGSPAWLAAASGLCGLSAFIRTVDVSSFALLALLFVAGASTLSFRRTPALTAALLAPFAVACAFAWWVLSAWILFFRGQKFEEHTLSWSSLRPRFAMAGDDLLQSLTWIGVVGLIAGAVLLLVRRRWFLSTFLLGWIVAKLLFYVSLGDYRARYTVDIYLPIAVVLAYLAMTIPRRYGRYQLAAVTLGCALLFSQIQPVLAARHEWVGGKRLAEYVAANTPDDALILVMDDAPFIEYYAARATIGHPIDDQPATDAFCRDLLERIRRGTPVYAVQSALQYDRSNIFRRTFPRYFDLRTVGQSDWEAYHDANFSLESRSQAMVWRVVPR